MNSNDSYNLDKNTSGRCSQSSKSEKIDLSSEIISTPLNPVGVSTGRQIGCCCGGCNGPDTGFIKIITDFSKYPFKDWQNFFDMTDTTGSDTTRRF